MFYDEPQIAGRLKQGKANDLAKKILHILKEGVRFCREKEMIDTNIWEFDPEADPPQPGNLEQVFELMNSQTVDKLTQLSCYVVSLGDGECLFRSCQRG